MFASSEIKEERKSRYGGGPHGLGAIFNFIEKNSICDNFSLNQF